MTVVTSNDSDSYTGNGVTTIFPFTFKAFEPENLLVSITAPDDMYTELVLGTDYSVMSINDSDGEIQLTSPVPAGYTLTISRNISAIQKTSFRNQGSFLPKIHENAFDYLTMLVQGALSTIARSLRYPLGGTNYDANNRRIVNMPDPVNNQDAATKNYVDVKVDPVISTVEDAKNIAVESKNIAVDAKNTAVEASETAVEARDEILEVNPASTSESNSWTKNQVFNGIYDQVTHIGKIGSESERITITSDDDIFNLPVGVLVPVEMSSYANKPSTAIIGYLLRGPNAYGSNSFTCELRIYSTSASVRNVYYGHRLGTVGAVIEWDKISTANTPTTFTQPQTFNSGAIDVITGIGRSTSKAIDISSWSDLAGLKIGTLAYLNAASFTDWPLSVRYGIIKKNGSKIGTGGDEPGSFYCEFQPYNSGEIYTIYRESSSSSVIVGGSGNELTKANARWYSKAIGEIVAFDAVDVPPTNLIDCRYVRLTANDSYNDGVLTSQTVSGTAPLITATGIVSLTGSLLNSKTLHLINTESRYLVAGSTADVLRDDALQNITGSMNSISRMASAGTSNGAFAQSTATDNFTGTSSQTGAVISVTFNASRVARTDTSTHGRDISKIFFMRVL